ncbi:hypothetical protein [Agathobaculum desmolans]|uniref:hypothetical protein n=1 Tax=Agathobaculum desmolans TaxID=39484 RepID=UPI0004E18708|nr:hypothetical protein [Agathobaculum desmolans]
MEQLLICCNPAMISSLCNKGVAHIAALDTPASVYKQKSAENRFHAILCGFFMPFFFPAVQPA